MKAIEAIPQGDVEVSMLDESEQRYFYHQMLVRILELRKRQLTAEQKNQNEEV